ncbi:uncharacterized protein [Montipora capricornis]|uniref:uncharacterized protein n=1 Tax=Montipora capricornis TaxID=246305 RepID=UPI0035F1EB96
MAAAMDFFRISIKGVQIKGYHHFKVKAPSGTPFIVRKEAFNEYDPFSLACLIPAEVVLIPEPLRKMAIYSKSQRKSYTLEDVRGSQIGRIQYFLNRELSYLLECGKISRIDGIVNGEPTVTVRPNAAQKFQRNKQAGGGAYIPATIQVEGPREHKEAVLDRVRTSLTECENGELMSIDIEN